MGKILRILNVEDSELDVTLLTRHLVIAGYEPISERVDTSDAMKAALEEKEWDIVLCDYSMPEFNALAALEVLHESGVDIPFIIISGTVGEDVAVQAMLTGAHDYLPKDNLTRLVPAIERELQEAENRRGQRRAEEERRLTQERYHTLFEYAPDGIVIASPDSYYLDANASMCRMLGYDHDELIGLHASDIVTAPEIEHIEAALEEIKATSDYSRQWQFRRKDGSEFPGEVIATIMPDGNLLAMIRDVTERKRAEDGLRESESLLAASQRITHLGSWVMDLSGSEDGKRHNERWSDEHYRIFGFEPGQVEITDEIFYNSVHPDDREILASAIRNSIEQKVPFKIEHRIILPDGRERMILAMAELVLDNNTGKPLKLLGSVQDITERKQLEERYRQAQKMEGIGVLAGGIAHDFNNLLTAINGYSNLTLRKMSKGDPLRHNIMEINDAGERAAELTSQLLAFSRKQVLRPRVYDLNAAITEIDRMLCRILRESIELRTVLAPDLGNIKADPGQIEQVIMNLAVNARDAMPKGGTLTIETKNVYLDEQYVSQHISISPGAFVRLTVTDTGVGMDAETQRHIFEPFFTTKEVGKGTGLGLSTVYGIVKQSGGDIMVYSEVGHGTTFKIYLPWIDQMVEKVKSLGHTSGKYTGNETILLVEDEDIVRNLVREVLTDNGYKILEAATGKAAMSICETYSEPIHMLLTDVVMPKMNGNELRDLVVKSHPDIKVLFMSGYTDDAVAFRGVLDSDAEFIEKPFTPYNLARKVREVLEH